jgi:hypothetical protein
MASCSVNESSIAVIYAVPKPVTRTLDQHIPHYARRIDHDGRRFSYGSKDEVFVESLEGRRAPRNAESTFWQFEEFAADFVPLASLSGTKNTFAHFEPVARRFSCNFHTIS